MASSSRLVSLNLGMQTVSMADFRQAANGGITLHGFKQVDLIVDPTADATRTAQLEAAVKELREGLKIPAKEAVNLCLPSQSVFARFVKLPGSVPSDVDSIIGFEAQQNVPFPIDEVVWDYQIMGDSKDGQWDVVLVAMKADQLSEVNAAVNGGGLRSGTIDAAPMSLYNAFRYNYSDLNGCSLLVDIGARTTNLIFIEDQRLFSRSIPVGGSSVSAAVAKEFKQDITLAEHLKIEKGSVGLGGAYAPPDDATEATIAKVVRNTMTRLHAEIARSISFYRQNQGGSAPVRAFLAGGTVSMPYMLEFFGEKLQIPIEYFNPLRNVTVASQEVAASVEGKTHVLGELVGAAVRYGGNCPIEINLRPAEVVREQDLAKRKPFLVVAALCILLSLGIWWAWFYKAQEQVQVRLDEVNGKVSQLSALAKQFDAASAEQKKLEEAAAPLLLVAAERAVWSEIIDELAAHLPERFIWITNLTPLSSGRPIVVGSGKAPTTAAAPAQQASGRGGNPRPDQQPQAPTTPHIDALQVTGLYLSNPPNEKEAKIIDEFVENLQKSPLFKIEDKAKVVTQRTTQDGQSWAYGYTIILPLNNPIALP
jgi:type IV pilus assembly protein PilM